MNKEKSFVKLQTEHISAIARYKRFLESTSFLNVIATDRQLEGVSCQKDVLVLHEQLQREVAESALALYNKRRTMY